MRERVAYLIDSTVDKRVRAYMDEFRQECFDELEDQRRVNQEHIEYYTKNKTDDSVSEQSVFVPRMVNPMYRTYHQYQPYYPPPQPYQPVRHSSPVMRHPRLPYQEQYVPSVDLYDPYTVQDSQPESPKAKKKKVVQPQKKEQKPIIHGESDTTQKKKPAQQLKAPGKSSKIPAKPAKAIIQ